MTCSSSKKVRLTTNESLVSSSTDLLSSETPITKVLFNIDIFILIFSNLTILDILKSLLIVNNTFYNFFKTNTKSFKAVKTLINYDYGDISNTKYFKHLFIDRKFDNSYEIINFYYNLIYVQSK